MGVLTENQVKISATLKMTKSLELHQKIITLHQRGLLYASFSIPVPVKVEVHTVPHLKAPVNGKVEI